MHRTHWERKEIKQCAELHNVLDIDTSISACELNIARGSTDPGWSLNLDNTALSQHVISMHCAVHGSKAISVGDIKSNPPTCAFLLPRKYFLFGNNL